MPGRCEAARRARRASASVCSARVLAEPSCDFDAASSFARQHLLYLLPLPQGQGSLRPGLAIVVSTFEPRRTHSLYRDLLGDATFYELLLACDRDAAHKGWSAKLHHDNLVALSEKRPELRPLPSYSTLRRFLKAHCLAKQRRLTSHRTAGAANAEARLFDREVRSYEAEYVGGVWHWDCHVGSKKVLTPRGEWQLPVLFGVLDDRSRLACHLQWYLTENAENIAHGLSQAFQKRGLPRSAQSDNGAAMTAVEITEGLSRLGVLHERTLPYTPEANGKIETLWGVVEGRLLAMLEDVPDLTLAFLNEATQAWVERDYNRRVHSETNETPIARFLAGPDVIRPCPDSAALKLAFTKSDRRSQRRSDGTITVEGNRFEVPSRYRHFTRLEIRYASWDLTHVYLVDEHTGQLLCRLFPQDKVRNAGGLRRPLE